MITLAGGAVNASPVQGYSTKTKRAAVRYVKSKVGNFYVYGGTGPVGFDCSGLVYAAYRRRIPRTSYAQLAAGNTGRRKQVGDLLFRGSGHVGIYVGRGRAIHATKPGSRISYISSSYFDSWRVASATYGRSASTGNRADGSHRRGSQHPAGWPQETELFRVGGGFAAVAT